LFPSIAENTSPAMADLLSCESRPGLATLGQKIDGVGRVGRDGRELCDFSYDLGLKTGGRNPHLIEAE
jgi:hypothetical protein